MKLLHVADLHFRARWFEWVAAQAEHFDAVCVAGDWLDMFGTYKASLRAQSRWVRDWLRAFPQRLFGCTGNHDWWESDGVVDTDARGGWLAKGQSERVTVDGQSGECAGTHIYCQPYRGPHRWPESCVGKWILLHHVPPALAATALSGIGKNDVGCRVLAGNLTTAARPPWIVLSGHLHRPKSWRGRCGPSWSLNPTCDEQASFPNHIMIDTASGTLTWVTERMGSWPVTVL